MKKLFNLTLLVSLLFAGSLQAQFNAYKTILSKVSDSTATTPSGYGAIRYNTQGGKNKWQFDNGAGFVDFGSGGGNLTGAITSSGLATSLGSFTSNALGTAISDPVRTVTGTDAIVQADNGRTIYFNSATPFNFTIDALTINTFTMFRNIGTATVSFVDGSGVTSTGATALLADEVGGIEYIASTTPIISVVGSGGGSMVYPGAGIPLSTGSAWGTSITDNSANWNAAAARTFSNGLTETGGAVKLGGALTGNTTISGLNNSLNINLEDEDGESPFTVDIEDQAAGNHLRYTFGAYDFILRDVLSSINLAFISSDALKFNPSTGTSTLEIQSTGNVASLISSSTRLMRLGDNGVELDLGSDAEEDIYVRRGTYLTRIPLGSSGDVLTNVAGSVGWAAPSGGGLTVGTSTITSGTNTKVLYNNSGVLGEYTVSGTGNVALTTSPVFTTPNIGTATGTASGNYSLASGGTATGTNTFAMGSNPFILTSGVTTGTGATAGIQNVFNSLTTGNGLDISSSSVSSGAIVKITGTGTAAASNTQRGLVVDVSGANATSTQTTHAGYFSNTKTGTSSSNIALYANASGATNNMAIYAPNGVVSLGAVPSGYNGRIYSTAGTGGRVASFGNLEITTSAGPSWSGTGLQATGSNKKITLYGGNWGTDNDQVDISFNATNAVRTGVDLGLFRASLGSFNTTLFQANSIAGFRFIDTWPTLTTPLNVVYGFDYSAGGAGNAVSEVAIRATRGQVVLGATGTSSANDRVKINGIGTTTGKGLVVNNSSGSERFSVQDDGVINVNGSGGTAGQVLVSNGTSAAAWGTPTVNITGSNQRYQTQVANISSSLVASGTGFAGLSNTSEYANKTILSVDFVIVMIKNDGTAVVYGKLTSIFRKNNSGTWTADVPGTPTISDITQLSGFVGDINGGVPGITWTTPGTTSGTWQLGYTAAISSTTN